jgi:hypothetical protein
MAIYSGDTLFESCYSSQVSMDVEILPGKIDCSGAMVTGGVL